MDEREEEASPDTSSDLGERRLPAGLKLLFLSFAALFLELMLIRWVPSTLRVVAYYANLMLISSFLGLGLGAMLSARRWKLFGWFPILLAFEVGFLYVFSAVALPGSGTEEFRFYLMSPEVHTYVVLVGIFLINALTFVCIGERIGALFESLPTLRAYSWDLVGSLGGTLAFAAFALLFFSPALGLVTVGLLYGAIASRRQRIVAAVAFLASLGLMSATIAPGSLWSPYYYITVTSAQGDPVDEPPADLRTIKDPPLFVVKVNNDFYQAHGTVDPSRYTSGVAPRKQNHRGLTFALRPGAESVLVLGAGGGMDVESALLAGAKRVDAVEIDPGLVALSNRFSASGIYEDSRVRVITDDARAYLERTTQTYDIVLYGLLDSQALSSSMANIRLDGFVYTVEGFRAAYARVQPNGLMALAFAGSGQGWIIHKLIEMVRAGTGRDPYVYSDGAYFVLCVPKGSLEITLEQYASYTYTGGVAQTGIDLATDDWPYLYLRQKGIPTDYLIVMGSLLLFCVGAVALLRRGTLTRADSHFFFLGVGFLLLQTKSIVDCALYFGATWLVTNLVVAGVLIMVLLANLVASRFPNQSARTSYICLFSALLIVSIVPRETVLAFPFAGRVLWTLLAVPSPIFFAGLIFSSSFRMVEGSASRLGANLVGATIGGFLEYLGMAIGHSGLSIVLICAYLASAVCYRLWRGQISAA